MKLINIEIKNYRSIKAVKLLARDGLASVFVGINESGKTNILKAINFLTSGSRLSKKDCRISASPDQLITDSFVKFLFQMNKNDIDVEYEKFKSRVISTNLDKPIISLGEKENLSLQEFFSKNSRVQYRVDILKETRTLQYFLLPKTAKIIGEWGYVEKNEITGDAKFKKIEAGGEVQANAVDIVDMRSIDNRLDTWIKPLTAEKLNAIVGSAMIKAAENLLPESLLWNFDPANILPSEIDIDTFSKNPDSCAPLKSIFMLAGISNFEEELLGQKLLGQHQFKAVLKKVSAVATEYLKGIWQDYKNVRLEITPNGSLMTISVVDDVTDFSFEHRSEGFKRFVSLLLLISAKVKNGEMKNMVLLFDEPEISLHPSGIKNLRDELFRIAETNAVFIATHSPYMINKENYDTNFVVKKISEITEVYQASEKSRLYEDEVLYSALGASIFEVISEKNVLFEGWQDKKIFDLYVGSQSKAIKNKYKNIGTCFSQGVKSIKNLSPIFQVANRWLLILSDSDAVAMQYKKEHDESRGYGEWITYAEIFREHHLPIPETIEDFYMKDYFLEKIKEASFELGVKINLADVSLSEMGRINSLKGFLYQQEVPKENIGVLIDLVKLKLASDCLFENIDKKYKIVIDFIESKIF